MADAVVTLLGLVPSLANTALDMAKTSDAAKRNAQLIEFQNAIIQFNTLLSTIQNENAALSRTNRDLEEQIRQIKNWEAESQRYELARPYNGVTVYALKKSMSNGQIPHYICASCYENGEKSVLQPHQGAHAYWYLTCQRQDCKASGFASHRMLASPKYAEEIEPI